NLYKHLQHCSTLLLSQITEYVKSFPKPGETTDSGPSMKAPKALGDLLESIVGAVLIDTKLNLDEVWRIFKPILSPIVTPDKLELPPLRELIELCDSLGYFVKENCTLKGEMVHAELRLQLKDVLLVGEGQERSRKAAKGKAASQLLKKLEVCEKRISKGASNTGKLGDDCRQTTKEDLPEPPSCKRQKGTEAAIPAGDSCKKAYCMTVGTPVVAPINMKKGGPRTSLFQLCKTMLWPMPTFETTESKSRTLLVFCEGLEKRTGFSSFVSKITLHIPEFGNVECNGDPRADKKSSFDSAALIMLHELERQGKIIISSS
ncbi:hypothetical protein CISIN_1g0003791mg, partial [Citrus sinensis]